MNTDALAARLLALVDCDDLDAAIEAGLADFNPESCGSLPADDRRRLMQARQLLLQAWAARERHRARNARLARRAAGLRSRRAASTATAGPSVPGRPGLPTAAAAALERARQRAGGGQP